MTYEEFRAVISILCDESHINAPIEETIEYFDTLGVAYKEMAEQNESLQGKIAELEGTVSTLRTNLKNNWLNSNKSDKQEEEDKLVKELDSYDLKSL